MKTCNNFGFCTFIVLASTGYICNYEGYCDYQAPRDSRLKSIRFLGDTCNCAGQEGNDMIKEYIKELKQKGEKG